MHRETFDDIRALLGDAAAEAPGLLPAQERTVRRAHRRAAATLAIGTVAVIATVVAAVLVVPSLRVPRERVPAAEREFGRVVSAVRTGASPSSVAVGAGSVWVANGSDGTLQRFDPAMETMTQIDLEVARDPHSGFSFLQVVEGEGAVWVLSPFGGELLRIDPTTERVTARITIPTALSLDVGAGAVWVTRLDGHVSRVDPATNQVVAEIRTGPRPAGIAAVEGSIWVVDDFAGTLTRIDPSTDEVVARVRTGANLSLSVAADATGAWATGCVERDVSGTPQPPVTLCDWFAYSVDAATGLLAPPMPLPSADGIGPPGSTAFVIAAADEGALWGGVGLDFCTAVCPRDTILRIDPATGRTEAMRLGRADGITGLAVSDGQLWAVTDGDALVRVELTD